MRATARQHLEPEDREVKLLDFQPKSKAQTLLLFKLILHQLSPGPENELGLNVWFEFGFCVCNESQVRDLSGFYIHLVLGKDPAWNPRPANDLRCIFKELWQAHRDSKLVSLIESKGLRFPNIPHLEAFLNGGPERHLSVWDLKKYISCADEGEMTATPPVVVDYGFANCKGWNEKHDLKDVYRRLLGHADQLSSIRLVSQASCLNLPLGISISNLGSRDLCGTLILWRIGRRFKRRGKVDERSRFSGWI